jgi:hypothetical protein
VVIKGYGGKGKQHNVKFEALQDLAMLANVGWYVTDYGVIEHSPDLGHCGLDADLLFKGLRD